MDLKILHTPVQMPGFVVLKKKKNWDQDKSFQNLAKTLATFTMHAFFVTFLLFQNCVSLRGGKILKNHRIPSYTIFHFAFLYFFLGGGGGPGAYVVMARSFLCETIAAQAIRWAENYKLTITEWRSIFQKFNCLMGDSIVWIWRLSAHRITT